MHLGRMFARVQMEFGRETAGCCFVPWSGKDCGLDCRLGTSTLTGRKQRYDEKALGGAKGWSFLPIWDLISILKAWRWARTLCLHNCSSKLTDEKLV